MCRPRTSGSQSSQGISTALDSTMSFLCFFFVFFNRWVTGHWSPCSATCEKGIQYREVTCVYQLQNGTYVNTRDLYCLGNKPTPIQSCEGQDCLSIWEASEWSKVRIWFEGETGTFCKISWSCSWLTGAKHCDPDPVKHLKLSTCLHLCWIGARVLCIL